MKILDLSAGNRAMWFDKNHPCVTFVDIRPEMKPTVVGDSRCLPKKVGTGFDLVVFDPPHVTCGPNGKFAKHYGSHSADEIRDIIRRSAKEAHRVSNPDALMAFKFNDHDHPFPKIIGLLSKFWEPLFGQITSTRSKHESVTKWFLLRRRQLDQAPFSLSE